MTYHIPAGTVCDIAPDDDKTDYRHHVTTRPLTFGSYRLHSGGRYWFARADHVLRIKEELVK